MANYVNDDKEPHEIITMDIQIGAYASIQSLNICGSYSQKKKKNLWFITLCAYE